MRLMFAIALQFTALFLAWLNAPWSLITAGILALAVLFIRARFTLRPINTDHGHPWGEL